MTEGRKVSFLFINVNHDVGYESSESIPISLGYILATLKAEGWHGLILDDLRDRPLTLKNLDRWIMRRDPLLVGFTTYQSTMDRIRFLCRYIKSRHRRIKIALGGPQVVQMPSEALTELEDVDILVRSEGAGRTPVVSEHGQGTRWNPSKALHASAVAALSRQSPRPNSRTIWTGTRHPT